jgi:hypothetical protein
MGATSVKCLSSSYWAKAKPPDYKDQSLDKALKAYEPLADKGLKIPNDLIPKTPDPKVSAINKCITDMKSATTELTKGVDILNKSIAAVQAVQAAAGKTATDLRKQAKDKQDKDKDTYENAAASAESIGSAAAGALKDLQ